MDNKSEFLVEAIKDTQNTIRAVDTKISTVLVLLLLPFSSLGRVFEHLDNAWRLTPSCLMPALVVAFVLFWGCSLCVLVRAIGAIDNPARHVKGGDTVSGCFYSGGIFPLSVTDALFNRITVLSCLTLSDFIENIPSDKPGLEKELAFEKMKLVYIREMKLNRLRYGLLFSTAWFGLGVLLYLLSRYLV